MTNKQQILLVTGARGDRPRHLSYGREARFSACIHLPQRHPSGRTPRRRNRTGGGSALAVRSDVSNSDDITRLFETIDAQPGRFAALVNNAGITGQRGEFMETSMSTVHQVFDVNVFGLMECSRQAVQRLSTQREALADRSSTYHRVQPSKVQPVPTSGMARRRQRLKRSPWGLPEKWRAKGFE